MKAEHLLQQTGLPSRLSRVFLPAARMPSIAFGEEAAGAANVFCTFLTNEALWQGTPRARHGRGRIE